MRLYLDGARFFISWIMAASWKSDWSSVNTLMSDRPRLIPLTVDLSSELSLWSCLLRTLAALSCEWK